MAKRKLKLTNYTKKRLTKAEKDAIFAKREFYVLRSLLGYSWAMFYILLGGREAGKSYAVTKFYSAQWLFRQRPFYWLRLTEESKRKLLKNNAEKLIDPDIRRAFNIELVTSGDNVYQVTKRSAPDKNGKTKILEKKLMCRVMALSTFYNDKGSGLFDNEFLNNPEMYYNICLDEMNREKNEKNSFDIVYSFVNQLENLIRSTKKRVRIIMIGNTLEEASDLLCSFNFIPEKFGRYKLHNKRAVIEYIEPSEAYLNRRKGTVADILLPNESTFTNKIDTDNTLIYKGPLTKPLTVIKFYKEPEKNFVLWNNGVIKKWKNNNCKDVLAMRPYLDELFDAKRRNEVFERFDNRSYKYRDLITFKEFQKELELLRPRR